MNKFLLIILLAVVGFLAQVVDGGLGMGYGVFSSSLLVGIGLAPLMASATVHTAEVFTTLFSGFSHWKAGNVNPRLALLLIVPGIIGGVLGASLLSSLSGKTMKPFTASILLIMGLIILYRFWRRKEFKVAIGGKENPLEIIGLGFIAALFDAVGGGGWGPIATPSLILRNNHSPHRVVGSVNFAEFFVTLAETLTFLIIIGLERYYWNIIFPLMIGGLIAAPLGALLCKKLPPRILGILIGLIIIILNLKTLVGIFL